MAYSALTDAEIAQDKFVTTTVMDKIQDNFAYLYGLGSDYILPINGSFETDTDSDGVPDNWTQSLYPGGSGGLYTTSPGHGAKAAYFTHPGGGSNGGGYLDSNYIEISQLQSLSLFYILWASAAGMKNQIRIRYYDKAKAYVSDVALYSSTSNPASATLYCSQFIPAATARYIKIRIIGGFTDTDIAGTAYFDGLWLVPTVVTDLIKDGNVTEAKLGASAVALSKLKTSTQSQDYDIPGSTTHRFVLTGGQYCFRPTAKGETTDVYLYDQTALTTTYAITIGLRNQDSVPRYGYVIHRYITSSGEVNWLFILREKETKKIIGRSIASDHPCFGNGGKPLLVPHLFGDYDETKHEIIVINPTNAEIEQMELETIVEDETKPDKDLIEVIAENYEIDEGSNPKWPDIPVTVGLPKHIIDKETGKKVLADYRFISAGTVIEPIKKIIPKPSYIKVKKLKKRMV